MLKKIIIILSLLIGVILTQACKEDPGKLSAKDIVAHYQGGKITLGEFEKTMLEKKFMNNKEAAAKSKLEDRKKFLREMALDKILFPKRAELQLDTTKYISDHYNKSVKGQAREKLYTSAVVEKVLTEEMYQKAYEDLKYMVLPAQIFLPIGKDETNEKDVKRAIDSLYNLLTVKNADFDVLALSSIKDDSQKKRSGDLGWIKRGIKGKQFDQVVFAMNKGDLSKPFKTKRGWHIVKLKDKKEDPTMKNYEDSKPALKKELIRKNKLKLIQQAEAYIVDLRTKHGVKVDDEVATFFLDKYNSLNTKDSQNDPLEAFTEQDKKKIILAYGKDTVNVDFLIKRLQRYNRFKRPPLQNKQQLLRLFQSVYLLTILDKEAHQLGYDKDEAIVAHAKKELESRYIRVLEQKLVLDKLQDPTDEEMKQYYEANKDRRFKTPKGKSLTFEESKKRIMNILKRKKQLNAVKNWKETILKENDFKIDNIVLEEAFYYVADDKK